MNRRLVSLAGLALAALLLAGCAAGPRERVVLLPDREGHVGVIEVSGKSGTTSLNEAYSGARISAAKVVVEKLDAAEVERLYGQVLQGLPASPQRFLLNFEFGSDRLTAQSAAMVPAIQNALRQFPAPEVVVIGHTDAVGASAYNDKLSLDRANRVRDILTAAGVAAEQIQTVGRGEREPLVAARPGVPEPRNRRVEIKLR